MVKCRMMKTAAVCVCGILICGLAACKDAYSVDIISGVEKGNIIQSETEEALETTSPEAETLEMPEEIPELTEGSAQQCEPTSPEAPSKALIDSYGYEEDGKSILSFDILPGEVIDGGDHYEVTAIYAEAIKVPADLKVGESVTLVFNEMTGEEKTLKLVSEGSLLDEENGVDYYYWPAEDGSPAELYWFSDDRVDKPFCEGKLYIRKFATSEIIISEIVELITEEKLAGGAWYNGVYFDEQGYVTRLCFIGD